MDLSYDDDIDTRCGGCGASAAGWTFASDGKRVYVCPDCSDALYRYVPKETIGEAPHPRAQFCRSCERLTFLDDLNHQKRCPDCQHGAGEREEDTDSEDTPPEVAVAQADQAGDIDWDDPEDE